MTSFKTISRKLSIESTLMLTIFGTLAFVIILTPQHPVDVSNPWILWPGVATAILVARDLNR